VAVVGRGPGRRSRAPDLAGVLRLAHQVIADPRAVVARGSASVAPYLHQAEDVVAAGLAAEKRLSPEPATRWMISRAWRSGRPMDNSEI